MGNLPRREFLVTAAMAAAAPALAQNAEIAGFEQQAVDPDAAPAWEPYADRKLRVGLVGNGLCKFASAFFFQDHPLVEVVAVSDLLPDRCAELAQTTRCATTYPSLEEMLDKEQRLEAVFLATDAPRHARQAIHVLERGLHVASAVPACFGSLEDAEALYDAVRSAPGKYMMFETSTFHEPVHAARTMAAAGVLGDPVYVEGEYYHYMTTPLPSYEDWRVGLPPQFYPTHSNAYYVSVAGGHFTEVSCYGRPSILEHLTPAGNRYGNPFGTEIALFRTDNGGAARMAVSWDTPGHEGEMGRIRTTRGTYAGNWNGAELPEGFDLRRPGLPPGVDGGGHGGSHGYLCDEFVRACLTNSEPRVNNIAWALNMTVAGIVAHESALKDGETMKIPTYRWPV